jgi:hypothetical protein
MLGLGWGWVGATWDCFDPGVKDGAKVVNTGPHTVLLEFGMVRKNRRSKFNSADEGQLKNQAFTNQIQHYGGSNPHAYLVTSCRMLQFLVHPSHLAAHEASLERLIQSGSTALLRKLATYHYDGSQQE